LKIFFLPFESSLFRLGLEQRKFQVHSAGGGGGSDLGLVHVAYQPPGSITFPQTKSLATDYQYFSFISQINLHSQANTQLDLYPYLECLDRHEKTSFEGGLT
jgi:hypothetical protein